jgi:hypothetical protein
MLLHTHLEDREIKSISMSKSMGCNQFLSRTVVQSMHCVKRKHNHAMSSGSVRLHSSTRHHIDLPIAKERFLLASLLNPFADLPYLVADESVLYGRVQGFASSTALVTAVLCGISGAALLQDLTDYADEEDKESHGETSAVTVEPKTQKEELTGVTKSTAAWLSSWNGTPLKSIRYWLLSFSFLCNAQGMLLSSLTLAALNSTPSDFVKLFVYRNSALISALGWSMVPGTLSLCAAATINAKLFLEFPLDDFITACSVGVLVTTGGAASLLLIQSHRIRSRLMKQLIVRNRAA